MRRPRTALKPAKPGPTPAIIPRATYRLQLHKDFGFAQASAIVPYLAALGISHVYCSPYLRARRGSMHGYDIIDHNALNPEIGDEAAFDTFVAALKAQGMGQLLDMVPNHMGVMGADNAWWLDVLENGQASAYADYFDIDWDPLDPVLRGKVLIPALGDQYGNALERGELKLAFDAGQGSFRVEYYAHRFPVDPREYARLLDELPDADKEVKLLSAAFAQLPRRDDSSAEAVVTRRRDKDQLKQRLAALAQTQAQLVHDIEQSLQGFNGDVADRTSFAKLDALLDAQAYRLAYWRVASDEINYRRFFDINDLAALRQENPSTFEDTHRFVLRLATEGKIDGMRIDHPDGLYDPAAYFVQLQKRYAELSGKNAQDVDNAARDRPLYVLIEKITAPHEDLPHDWAVHGSTGYRYANVVNGVFVNTAAKNAITRTWRSFVGAEAEDFEEMAYQGKRLIMRNALASELTVLANRLLRIARADRCTRDFTFNTLRQALIEVISSFPVYRTYITETPSATDQRYIDWAVARAKRHSAAAEDSIFDFIRQVLLVQPPADAPPERTDAYRAFAMRAQQFTSPVAAKGVEDTAFYRYNRLLSLNEVGGDPGQFGMTVKAFHGASGARAIYWPHTMVATSTHDNKRSEDVRARLNVLSEMPSVWRLALRRWSLINRSKRTGIDGESAPSRNDEYLLYQMLLGSFPHAALNEQALTDYRTRIERYMLKAIRESKRHTSWLTVNRAYEDAVGAFVHALLGKLEDNLFLQDFRPFARTIAWYGALNSLSITLVKLCSPGVPDIYQGNEMLDFSLVDPDNRRPVDYAQRRAVLELTHTQAPEQWLHDIHDGHAKLALIARALAFRKAQPSLFEHGDYLPLKTEGAHANSLLAFARKEDGQGIVVAAGRLYASLDVPAEILPLGTDAWGDTTLELGRLPVGSSLHNVLTGETLRPQQGTLQAAQLFARFPLALLHYRA